MDKDKHLQVSALGGANKRFDKKIEALIDEADKHLQQYKKLEEIILNELQE